MEVYEKRNFSTMLMVSGVTIILMFILSGWAWIQLPADISIPTHWNIQGEIDRYGGKIEGLLLMPFITLGVMILLNVIPYMDPNGDNILRSRQAYQAVWLMLLLLMLVIHISTVLNLFGYNINITMVVFMMIGVMLTVTGNYLGKIRYNYLFGIRTPWTLASELSWNKTHRFGGKLFILTGLATVIGAFFSTIIAVAIMLAGLMLSLIIIFAYSYMIWRQDSAISI